MPGVGVGGLISGLMNPGLDQSVAQHITPNPNPLAQQGGGPQNPKAVDSLGNPVPMQSPNLAPAAVTQPDPVNSSYAADLLKYSRASAAAADFNRNLEGMAAGFGTAQQQASKQAALGRDPGGTVGGGLADLAGIQAMQEKTISDNEHARFMGNAAVFAQTMSQATGQPISVQQATEIMNDPDLMKAYTTAAGANMQTPDKLKEADAEARAWATANPTATPQQIAQHKSDFLAQTAGGLSTVGKNLAEDRRNWMAAHPGATFQDMVADKPELADETTYVTTKQEQVKAAQKQSADVQEFKDSATADYSAANSKLARLQPVIDRLAAHPEYAQQALQSFRATTGKWSTVPLIGNPDQNVRQAAADLQTLQGALSGSQLSDVKNVRNSREFNSLAAAATGGLDAGADPNDFAQTLQDIRTKYLDAKATLELTVGHKLTGELVGHGQQDLTKAKINGKSNPWYNQGSQDNDFSGMSSDDADKAYEALPHNTRYVGPDGVPRTKP